MSTNNFKASPQQARFFRWIIVGEGSAILEAVAGSGKTTTLIRGLGKMNGTIFFGAYNKKIADEIKAKAEEHGLMRPGLVIGTMHSAGFAAFRKTYPKVQLDEKKVRKIILDMSTLGGDSVGPAILPFQAFVEKMVSLGKQHLMSVKCRLDNLKIWRKLVDHFSAAEDLPEDADLDYVLSSFVIPVYERSVKACQQVIDFDDMIFAPLAFKCRMFKNDWVLIDECQDLNIARRELAKAMLKEGGRLVAVGDSRQAIYGFTGAGADSVERITSEFACKRLPLTVTYRCPKKVVEYVHQWVDHIQAHESAKDGEVVTYERPGCDICKPLGSWPDKATCPGCKLSGAQAAAPWFLHRKPSADSAVLCRYTKPLIDTAYGMLREGIACKVEGREIGKGLIKLAQRWAVKGLDALDKRLDTYLKLEVDKAMAKDNEAQAQAIEDKVGTLRVFIERTRAKGKSQIADLVVEIESLFADDVKGVCTLSTGHKSKGREWRTVYWLQAALRTRRPLKDWEAGQETNLNYVIGTRAMDTLVLIPEGYHSAPKN